MTETELPGGAPGTVPAQSLDQKPVTKCPLPLRLGHSLASVASVLSCPGCNQWARKSRMGVKNADWQKLKMERRVMQIGNVNPQPGREHRPCRRRAPPVTILGHSLGRPRGSQL